MRSVTTDDEPVTNQVVDGPTILEFQHLVRRIPVADNVFEYAASLVRATRPGQPGTPDFVNKLMSWGAGPRASLNLIVAGKARAALRGRCHVTIEDIREVCLPILRHRIIPNFALRRDELRYACCEVVGNNSCQRQVIFSHVRPSTRNAVSRS